MATQEAEATISARGVGSCFICNIVLAQDESGVLIITLKRNYKSHNIYCHPECFFFAAGSDYRKALNYDKMIKEEEFDIEGIDYSKTAETKSPGNFLDSYISSGSFPYQYETFAVHKTNKAILKTEELEYKLKGLERLYGNTRRYVDPDYNDLYCNPYYTPLPSPPKDEPKKK